MTTTAHAGLDVRAALDEKVLACAGASGAREVADMAAGHVASGLLISSRSLEHVGRLASECPSATIVADTRGYSRGSATSKLATAVAVEVSLGANVEDAAGRQIEAQIDAGATVAMYPSLYINPFDTAALRRLVAEANTIDRPDVLLNAPLDAEWLDEPSKLRQAISILSKSAHPVSVMLGGQWDPVRNDGRVAALRTLINNIDRPYLLCSDMIVFDALAHGAAGAGIGSTGTFRHIVRPGERTMGPAGTQPPSVLLRELMSFISARTLAEWFDAARPPTCSLQGCDGLILARLRATASDRRLAVRHNTHTWLALADDFLAVSPADRAAWLHGQRQHAQMEFARYSRITGVRHDPPPALQQLLRLGV